MIPMASETPALAVLELTPAQFERISQLMYELCGVTLRSGKEALVRARLSSRVRALGLPDVDAYLEHMAADDSGQELAVMIDALTTHKTFFFREPAHFGVLRQLVAKSPTQRRWRIWSAGCSSGEEPYSLAITLREAQAAVSGPAAGNPDLRILATDVSREMVARVREALYEEDRLRDVPPLVVQRYFRLARTQPTRAYHVGSEVRGLVWPAYLNLLDPWPMRGPFDAIFCRNVMIYFDGQTRQTLVSRFGQLLRPGGLLFVGLSESLSAYPHGYRYVQPGVYAKENAAAPAQDTPHRSGERPRS